MNNIYASTKAKRSKASLILKNNKYLKAFTFIVDTEFTFLNEDSSQELD